MLNIILSLMVSILFLFATPYSAEPDTSYDRRLKRFLYNLDSTSNLNLTSAFEISEYCKVRIEGDKYIIQNQSWCNNFIEMEAHQIMAESKGKWCLDSNWKVDSGASAVRWKSYFLAEAGIKTKERTVRDVLITMLNRKYKCKTE